MTQSTADIKTASFDPYYLDPRDVMEPPTEFSKIIKKIGPGIILSASIVGSGELIATTTLGAEVGRTESRRNQVGGRASRRCQVARIQEQVDKGLNPASVVRHK